MLRPPSSVHTIDIHTGFATKSSLNHIPFHLMETSGRDKNWRRFCVVKTGHGLAPLHLKPQQSPLHTKCKSEAEIRLRFLPYLHNKFLQNLPYAGGPIVAVIGTAAQSQLIECDWAAVPGTATIKCVALCLVNNEERCSLFNQLILGRAKNWNPTYLILMAYTKDRPYILKSWKPL